MTSDFTALPKIDKAAADAFWQRYLISAGTRVGSGYTDVACFGDSVELADELIGLVLHGPKRATAGGVAQYEADRDAIPEVGDRWIACDGMAQPRAVIETTDVRVGPLSSVDDAFAFDEGEGDRTRASWLRDHTAFFARSYPAIGEEFHPDIQVVFERFDVLYQEPPTSRRPAASP